MKKPFWTYLVTAGAGIGLLASVYYDFMIYALIFGGLFARNLYLDSKE